MKNTNLITLFTALFVGIIMISCGKYEEGPGFSLLPKKTRLQQNWKPVQTVDANGNINNLDDDGSYIEFVKGGTLNIYNHSLMSLWGSDGAQGTWELSEDKTQININYSYAGLIDVSATYTILKLKINDLGLMDENGYKTYYDYK